MNYYLVNMYDNLYKVCLYSLFSLSIIHHIAMIQCSTCIIHKKVILAECSRENIISSYSRLHF